MRAFPSTALGTRWHESARPDLLRLRSGQALAAQRTLARDDKQTAPLSRLPDPFDRWPRGARKMVLHVIPCGKIALPQIALPNIALSHIRLSHEDEYHI